eukprot:TRINITY_DN3961_c0_g1_i1.p1 TRINITY_DN3961_c0_g1~~TRINITY_DN3961_c0_g1_i1.p1  ORF type:complete len:722 (+),score=126.79 TRINITY_DN3961_c0_g1_i1:53-2167(+)
MAVLSQVGLPSDISCRSPSPLYAPRTSPYVSLSVLCASQLNERAEKRSKLLGNRVPEVELLRLNNRRSTRDREINGRVPNTRVGRASSSLGFTASRRALVQKAANNLLREASSLLVFQDVLARPPGQAFLRLLLVLRRDDDGAKVLEAYGEFFRVMAMEKQSCWEDYILDRILAGVANPYARAVATLEGESAEASITDSMPLDVPAALRAAAAVDLDSLQRLSVAESTLCGWVADVVPDLRPEWRAAACATLASKSRTAGASIVVEEAGNLPSPNREEEQQQQQARGSSWPSLGYRDTAEADAQQLPGRSQEDEAPRAFGFGFSPRKKALPVQEDEGSDEPSNVESPSTLSLPNAAASASGDPEDDLILPGPTGAAAAAGAAAEGVGAPKRERGWQGRRWREQVGSLWKWSEGLPLLERFYFENGTGTAAQETYLVWREGGLRGALYAEKLGQGREDNFVLNVHEYPRRQLEENLEMFASGERGENVILYGPDGIGKTWLLYSVLDELAEKHDCLRQVALPRNELKGLGELLEAIEMHPRLRFVIVLDDLGFRPGEEASVIALKWRLEESRRPWPQNALLAITSVFEEMPQVMDFLNSDTWKTYEKREGLGGILLPYLPLQVQVSIDTDEFEPVVRELVKQYNALAASPTTSSFSRAGLPSPLINKTTEDSLAKAEPNGKEGLILQAARRVRKEVTYKLRKSRV